MSILNSRVPIEKALQDPSLTENEKKKLILAQQAREFAEKNLSLKSTQNYSSYVKLDRPYVTYVVSASPKWELKHHLWSFPFVGSVPYKGYFNEKDAKQEEDDLKKQNLDTYLRGVSAYSTLGWFSDPLLSTMMGYSDHELVNTIIHETVHATLYIKNSADFNERLAVFLGNKGMELFYKNLEGESSQTLHKAAEENEDDRIFSKFISDEIKDLEQWYKDNKGDEALREKRLTQIQEKFVSDIKPRLTTSAYSRFAINPLNNARLSVFKTYMQDLSDFQKLFTHVNGSFPEFIKECKKLENSKKPEEDLKALVSSYQ